MADNVQPDAGEQGVESSSGLLISVDPLQGANNYKLSGDDSDGGDKGGLLGDDSSDSDGSDSDALGGDDSDASDSDSSDKGDGSDADGTDAEDADGTDTGLDADGTDPLGIAPGDAGGTGAARPVAVDADDEDN
jgi:hypothetical protein